jgi:hypothetical protein
MDIFDKVMDAESYWQYAQDTREKPEVLLLSKDRMFSNGFDDDNFIDSNNVQNHVSAITLLDNMLISGSDMLYLACGFGLGIKLFEMQGFNVKGIDINPRYVDFCKKHGLNVSKGNAVTFEGIDTDKKYDIIISRDFLRKDYLHENFSKFLHTSLENQYTHLNSGGMAIVYSQLFETYNANYARTPRFRIAELLSHGDYEFERLDRYQIHYAQPKINQYVDVFVK